jgi:Phage integrase, N-terminal SAM-like domain
MTDQFPTLRHPAALAPLPAAHLVPALITGAGEAAAWRYIDFFTANIRNPHTRRAYGRACQTFFAWCDTRGLSLGTIRPYDVSLYIETRQQTHSAPDVKQQLSAVRMLFDWLILGQIVPYNPAAAVRGPKHVVKTGVTPVLDAREWRALLDAIPTATVRDLRDRALIATLTYSFARITAALTMKVEDLRPKGAGWQLRCMRKAASTTSCRATTRWPRRCAPTSMPPASPRTARAICSARPAAATRHFCRTNPWVSRTPGG